MGLHKKQTKPKHPSAKRHAKGQALETGGRLKNKKLKIDEGKLKEQLEKRKKHQEEEEEVFSDVEEERAGQKGMQMTAEEQELLEQFLVPGGMGVEQQVEEDLQLRQQEEQRQDRLKDPKVLAVFADVAKLMKEFTRGQLSEPLKALPYIQEWRALLDLTIPQEWSHQAMERATRYLVATLDAFRTQAFLQDYLLPAVRLSIGQHKKLDVHLFMALKRSVYKPTAFFKGIMFALLSHSPKVKECQILCSIVQRVSIPVVYSSVALLKLCEMPSGLSWMFIKVLLEKQYALPLKVVTRLHSYFSSFSSHPSALPVLWHQTLLSFAIHYSQSLEDIQVQGLKQLAKKQKHTAISPQVVLALNGEYKEVERLRRQKGEVRQFEDNDMILE